MKPDGRGAEALPGQHGPHSPVTPVPRDRRLGVRSGSGGAARGRGGLGASLGRSGRGVRGQPSPSPAPGSAPPPEGLHSWQHPWVGGSSPPAAPCPVALLLGLTINLLIGLTVNRAPSLPGTPLAGWPPARGPACPPTRGCGSGGLPEAGGTPSLPSTLSLPPAPPGSGWLSADTSVGGSASSSSSSSCADPLVRPRGAGSAWHRHESRSASPRAAASSCLLPLPRLCPVRGFVLSPGQAADAAGAAVRCRAGRVPAAHCRCPYASHWGRCSRGSGHRLGQFMLQAGQDQRITES